MIKIFRISLVLLWMLIIFTFSQTKGEKSANTSIGIIKNTVLKIGNGLYHIKLIKKPLTDKKASKIANSLNYPARKIMHMSEYFILTILIYNVLVLYPLKKKFLWNFLGSFIYAISDEIHQMFTARTSSFVDVLIDSIGIILAIYFIYNVNKIKTKRTLYLKK